MDLLKTLAVSVFLLSAVKNIKARNRNQITLAVYYESLSADSEDFIVNQLLPATTVLGKYLSLRFIPFGNARFLDKSTLHCVNGESECKTNMVHQCVLHIMEEKGKTNLEKVEFLKCDMTTKSALTFYIYECTKINNTVLKACMTSPSQGLTMQKNAEYLTKMLSPASFPAVTINGVYNRDLEWSVRRNLIRTLCRLVSMPPCSQYEDEEPSSSTEESTTENSNENNNDIY